jgi:hypothetical protein
MLSPPRDENNSGLKLSNDGLMVLDGERSRRPESWNDMQKLRPQSQQPQQHTRHTRLCSIGYLLFFALLIQFVYNGWSPSTVSNHGKVDRPIQSRQSLHFAPLKDGFNGPGGLFIDDNKTWHAYYQCQYHA